MHVFARMLSMTFDEYTCGGTWNFTYHIHIYAYTNKCQQTMSIPFELKKKQTTKQIEEVRKRKQSISVYRLIILVMFFFFCLFIYEFRFGGNKLCQWCAKENTYHMNFNSFGFLEELMRFHFGIWLANGDRFKLSRMPAFWRFSNEPPGLPFASFLVVNRSL